MAVFSEKYNYILLDKESRHQFITNKINFLLISEFCICQNCGLFLSSTTEKLLEHCRSCSGKDRPDSTVDKSYNYICYSCDYHTCVRECMKKHIRTHNGDKPYKCTHCSYSASRRDTLEHHIQVSHLQKKKFACPVCGYKCSKKYNLITHASTKHGVDLRGVEIPNVENATSITDRILQTNNISNEILTPDIWSDPEIEDEES